jgi:tRNA threonylcarbamoyladenosine biosynthesis protein TsaE
MQVKGVDKILSSVEEMFQFGVETALSVDSDMILALKGDLGAGKTTFLKGFISALTQTDPDLIQSPTFTYLQIYEGKKTVYHFDLYRIAHYEQFILAGFEDYLSGICCIEWAERIENCLPEHTLFLELSYFGEHARKAVFYQKSLL